MRTRIHKWLDTRLGGIFYGVQVRDDGKWKHTHRNGKPLIFRTLAQAEKRRVTLRALGREAGS